MEYQVFGHGFSPDTISHAKRTYTDAWRWRVAHREAWQAVIEAAHAKAACGERIGVASLIAGTVPQRFAPLVARWLKSERPKLLPHIETRRSVFDLFTG